MADREYQTVKIEREGGVTFLVFNRPEKRNALSPQHCNDIVQALTDLETDAETQVLVVTGAGEAFCAGMDLREFFRALDDDPDGRHRAQAAAQQATRHKLVAFPKVTIAMVNGWCFGGGFSPLVACDLAIAAEEAVFGVSEVNWGIIPGGFVSKDLMETLAPRHAFYYTLTGKPFDGKRAAEIGLVNFAVPRAELRARTLELAQDLMKVSPAVLRAAKQALRAMPNMTWDEAWDYTVTKNVALRVQDPENSRYRGMQQFLDDKVYRPGLGPQPRPGK
jgi:trans-feruloyl-CoA hydratase/vanillin synthase